MNRGSLFASAALLAVVAANTSATAQSAGEDIQPTPPDSTAASDGLRMGEIVVTSQRRSERLLDVPISVTALTGEQLAQRGITDMQALTSTTPGLQMEGGSGGWTLPAIRGVSSQVTTPGGDVNVAIYLDGVYQPFSLANGFDLPDVERVEVLKGPQGTLFGRNATGGAIQVITRDPSYDTEGNLTLGYGRFNERTVKGFVSAPIIEDRVAYSLAGYVKKSDGFLTDYLTGGDAAPISSELVRGKLRLDPTDWLKVILTGFYSDHSDPSYSFGVPLNGNTIGRSIPGTILLPGDPYTVGVNTLGDQDQFNQRTSGFSAKAEAQLPFGALSSTTAYAKIKGHGNNDTDNSIQPAGVTGLLYITGVENETFTQELNYASDFEGKFNFTSGVFYINNKGGWQPLNVLSDVFPVTIANEQNTDAWAVFGEVYYDLTDRLQLIAGLRYGHEERDLYGSLKPLGSSLVLGEITPDVAQKSWNSTTPRFSVKYDLTDSSNVYFTYSEGFKSGVFQDSSYSLQPDGSLPVADPEQIKSYEIGYKGSVTDNFDLTAAVFHYDYSDLQVIGFTCVPVGSPTCVNLGALTNAAEATVDGVDLDGTMQFTNEFSLRVGVSLLDATYDSFPDAPVSIPIVTPNGLAGNTITPADVSGNRMQRAPETVVSATANYDTELSGGNLFLTATVYHASEQYYTFDESIQQDAYTTLDARASWSPARSGFTISFYGKNLTDEVRIGAVMSADAGDAVAYQPPRTYGMELSYSF